MKIVAIKGMSAGNDSVGDMWKEVKIFDWSTPVSDIVEWAGNSDSDGDFYSLTRNLTITVADED